MAERGAVAFTMKELTEALVHYVCLSKGVEYPVKHHIEQLAQMTTLGDNGVLFVVSVENLPNVVPFR